MFAQPRGAFVALIVGLVVVCSVRAYNSFRPSISSITTGVIDLTSLPEQYSEWAYAAKVNLDTNSTLIRPIGSLLNFPLCVYLDSTNFDFTKAKADGSDLRFIDTIGTALLFEKEYWNSAKKQAVIWVNVPRIQGNVGFLALMLWGNSLAQDRFSLGTVFKQSNNYHTVLHLNMLDRVCTDATGNGHDATVKSTGSSVGTMIGPALHCDQNSYALLPPSSLSTNWTMSAWIHHEQSSADYGIIGATKFQIWRDENGSSDRYGFSIQSTGQPKSSYGTTSINQNGNYFVTLTQNSGSLQLYVNGKIEGAPVASSFSGNDTLFIGRGSDPSQKVMVGTIDEVEISSISRSADWISLTYATQNVEKRVLLFESVPLSNYFLTKKIPDTIPPVCTSILSTTVLTGNKVKIRWSTPESSSPDADTVIMSLGESGKSLLLTKKYPVQSTTEGREFITDSLQTGITYQVAIAVQDTSWNMSGSVQKEFTLIPVPAEVKVPVDTHTVKPLSITGAYTGGNSISCDINNTSSIDSNSIDSVMFSYAFTINDLFKSTAGNKFYVARNLIKNSTNSVFTIATTNSLFLVKGLIYCAIRMHKLNGSYTDTLITSFTIGSIDPTDSNVLHIDSSWFDSKQNSLKVAWSSISQDNGTLEWGISCSRDSSKTSTPSVAYHLLKSLDTVSIELADSIQFNTLYILRLWIRQADENWNRGPVTTIRTSGISWEPVTFFDNNDSIDRAFNGSVLLRKPSAWQGIFIDTVVPFMPGNPRGLITIGNFVSFKNGSGIPRLYVGFKVPALTGTQKMSDVHLYRCIDGKWILTDDEELIDNDYKDSILWLYTNRLNEPLGLMVDTIRPKITLLSDTSSPVEPDGNITTSFSLSDNVGNVKVQYLLARGNDKLAVVRSKRLDSVKDTFTIPSKFLTTDNSVRALITVDDGHFVDTINISRQIIRKKSDPIATNAMHWVPIRVTAYLDSPSIKSVFSSASKSGQWDYDSKSMRIFKWGTDNSNGTTTDEWIEYSEKTALLFTITPGSLLWFKTRENISFDFGSGVTPSLKKTVVKKLPPKSWTDFAVPFKFDINLFDVLEANSTYEKDLQFYSWNQDVSQNYYGTALYVPMISGLDKKNAILGCGDHDGYSIYNASVDTVYLSIPPTPATMSSQATSLSKTSGTREFSFQIEGQTEVGKSVAPLYFSKQVTNSSTIIPVGPSFSGIRIGFANDNSTSMRGALVSSNFDKGELHSIRFVNEGSTPEKITISTKPINQTNDGVYAAIYDPKVTLWKNQEQLTVSLEPGEMAYRIVGIGKEAFFTNEKLKLTQAGTTLLTVGRNLNSSLMKIGYRIGSEDIRGVEFTIVNGNGRTVGSYNLQKLLPGNSSLALTDIVGHKQVLGNGLYILQMKARGKGKNFSFVKRFMMFR